MKTKIIFSIIFYLMLNIKSNAQPVKVHGQLRVEGVILRDKNNDPVVLHGMSFGWHNYWPRLYNAGAVSWLYHDWDCSVVRAAMGVEPRDGYIEKPGWSEEKIRAVVDAAIKEGIYVIIDFHSHNIRLKEAKKFFTDMARSYGTHSNVIYEIFNEPDYESWNEVKAYSAEIISTIRAIDPDNIILIGNPHWDQDIDTVANDRIQGFDNIMYTVHFYAATHKQELRDKCDYALGKGIPIFISESAGMEASGNGKIDYDEWDKWIGWAEKNKISWVTWSVADKDEACSVLRASADSNGGWTEKDLKESGIKSRQLIKMYSQKDK